jgi:hypothetical protein
MEEKKPINYRHRRWAKHFDEIDLEIARAALILKVRILDPGVIERVLDKDASVCSSYQEKLFDKLRNLLMMHYSDRAKAVVALGPEEARQVVMETVARLQQRVGDRLGTPAA